MFNNCVNLVVLLVGAIISAATADLACLYNYEPPTARGISMDFSALFAIQTDSDWSKYYGRNHT